MKNYLKKSITLVLSNKDENCCIIDKIFTCFSTTIKVGATESIYSNNDLKRAYFRADYSNYGACVDIYAPGRTLYSIDNVEYEVLKINISLIKEYLLLHYLRLVLLPL